MAYELPELGYEYGALEPYIDQKTMEVHYTKHHAAYVKNLNEALTGQSDFQDLPLKELMDRIHTLPEDVQTAVRNNGGGHYNHTMFWTLMKAGGSSPGSEITSAINKDFGGMDQFREVFAKAAMTRFGSGWAWLTVSTEGSLSIGSTPNQDNPLMTGLTPLTGHPILGLDVWEHAYYLKYQNLRADYIKAWWEVVNWEQVEANLRNARA